VTVNIPLRVQQGMAVLSMAAMALFIGLQIHHDLRAPRESLTTIELTLFWSAIGLALYALRRRVADGGTARRPEHAQ
jgi:hypothetical protein